MKNQGGTPDGAEELWAIKVQQGSDDINTVTTKAFEYPLPKNNRSSDIKCWGKWNMQCILCIIIMNIMHLCCTLPVNISTINIILYLRTKFKQNDAHCSKERNKHFCHFGKYGGHIISTNIRNVYISHLSSSYIHI